MSSLLTTKKLAMTLIMVMATTVLCVIFACDGLQAYSDMNDGVHK